MNSRRLLKVLWVHCHIGSLEKYGANILQRYLVHCHVKKHRFQPNSLRALLVTRVYFSFNKLNKISILLRYFKWYSSALDKRAACMFYDERSSIFWFFHFDFSSGLIYLRSTHSLAFNHSTNSSTILIPAVCPFDQTVLIMSPDWFMIKCSLQPKNDLIEFFLEKISNFIQPDKIYIKKWFKLNNKRKNQNRIFCMVNLHIN